MALEPFCPRCPAPLTDVVGEQTCVRHGTVEPLWRAVLSDYESFAEMVSRTGDLPTYLPWPMSPGWSISDFGYVGGGGSRSRATVTTTTGSSDADGEVSVTVVTEDPGTGLGARCAGLEGFDPGPLVGDGPYAVRVRAAGHPVPLWVLETDTEEPLAQTVLAGEAEGRWLWMVIRPASAMLLLCDEWLLADVTGFGPEALELPFGGPRPAW